MEECGCRRSAGGRVGAVLARSCTGRHTRCCGHKSSSSPLTHTGDTNGAIARVPRVFSSMHARPQHTEQAGRPNAACVVFATMIDSKTHAMHLVPAHPGHDIIVFSLFGASKKLSYEQSVEGGSVQNDADGRSHVCCSNSPPRKMRPPRVSKFVKCPDGSNFSAFACE